MVDSIFCGYSEEKLIHLSLHCEVISHIWFELLKWLQFNIIIPPNLFMQLNCRTNEVGPKKLRPGASLVWHATIWVIWEASNDRIFNNKVLSWYWSINRLKIACVYFMSDVGTQDIV